MPKIYQNQNVYEAAVERVGFILDEFQHFYVSFSGGKDSGAMTNLVIEAAARKGRLPVPVLFYDWEAIYKETHAFVSRMLHRPEVIPIWVCLPVTERNGSSVYEPFWMPWSPEKRHLWIRDIPDYPFVVHDGNIPASWQSWYEPQMDDQELFILFGDWYARQFNADKVANFVAIRVDESHDRYKMLKTKKNRIKYHDRDWCFRYKENQEEVWYTMPIYDWKFSDVWKAVWERGWDYNRIYDRFYYMGVPFHSMRVCNPYGEQQKRGLHQYHQCEPETWFKVVNRVSGANFGAYYNRSKVTQGQIHKPENMTWKEYTYLLLDSLPDSVRPHYRHIVARTLWWHRKRSRELDHIRTITDTDEEARDLIDQTGQPPKEYVSWKEIASVIIKGDYWAKKLYFAETQKERTRQRELIKKYKVI